MSRARERVTRGGMTSGVYCTADDRLHRLCVLLPLPAVTGEGPGPGQGEGPSFASCKNARETCDAAA